MQTAHRNPGQSSIFRVQTNPGKSSISRCRQHRNCGNVSILGADSTAILDIWALLGANHAQKSWKIRHFYQDLLGTHRAKAAGPTPLARTLSEHLPPDLIWTRFWPDSDLKSPFSGPNQVQIRSWGRCSEMSGPGGVGPAGMALWVPKKSWHFTFSLEQTVRVTDVAPPKFRQVRNCFGINYWTDSQDKIPQELILTIWALQT